MEESIHPIIRKHELSLGIKVATKVSDFVGSWPFIIGQTLFLFGWVLLNAVFNLWDRPPFILLNLILSFEAGYTGSIILLASNSAYKRDRALWEHHYKLSVEADKKLHFILEAVNKLTKKG